jgi:putative spermidine/putrescine transport system permease protein
MVAAFGHERAIPSAMSTIAANWMAALPRSGAWRSRARLYALIFPAAAMLLVFYVFPLVQVLWISVTEPQPGPENYALLFTSPSIAKVATTTLRICALTTVFSLVFGYTVAYALVHSDERTQRIMMLGVLMPLWIPALVRAFAWVALLRREGLVNSALLGLNVADTPLSLLWNEFAVTLGLVYHMLPYAILPLVVSMRQINPLLVAAARGAGASPTQAFFRVFLPLSLPGAIASGLLVFILTIGLYITPVLLGGGRVTLIAQYIGSQFFDLFRLGVGTMLATSLIAVVVLTLLLMSRFVDIGRMFGAK